MQGERWSGCHLQACTCCLLLAGALLGLANQLPLSWLVHRRTATPSHTHTHNTHTIRRAHYAMAQVHALTSDWPAAEAAYTRCLEAARSSRSQIRSPPADDDYGAFAGQALFCIGTARAFQGRHVAALEAYEEAERAGYAQPHALGQARGAALLALGRLGEAGDAVAAALAAGGGGESDYSGGGGGGGGAAGGFVDMSPVLRDLARRIEERRQQQ